jgi:hypothetical protein
MNHFSVISSGEYLLAGASTPLLRWNLIPGQARDRVIAVQQKWHAQFPQNNTMIYMDRDAYDYTSESTSRD